MTPKDKLIDILTKRGFPKEFGETIAQTLKSEKAINRMISYALDFPDAKAEDLADEMLAIESDIEKWRDKKCAEFYNSKINDYINNKESFGENHD